MRWIAVLCLVTVTVTVSAGGAIEFYVLNLVL
jgi:hypothetical protein